MNYKVHPFYKDKEKYKQENRGHLCTIVHCTCTERISLFSCVINGLRSQLPMMIVHCF
jgi:hypothetical protein